MSIKLYHYTTYDSFYRIWESQGLRFGVLKNMNDLYEKNKFAGIDIAPGGISKAVREILDIAPLSFVIEQVKRFRQISFCSDADNGLQGCLNSMMWGQYAKNDKGVCIEFDSDKLCHNNICCSKKVDYVEKVPFISVHSSVFDSAKDINDIKDIICNKIIENQDVAFFTKHVDWQHEKEYRIISNPVEEPKYKDLYLPISGAITCIYVLNRESLDTKILKRLIGGDIPIKCIGFNLDREYVCLKINE